MFFVISIAHTFALDIRIRNFIMNGYAFLDPRFKM